MLTNFGFDFPHWTKPLPEWHYFSGDEDPADDPARDPVDDPAGDPADDPASDPTDEPACEIQRFDLDFLGCMRSTFCEKVANCFLFIGFSAEANLTPSI